MITEDYVSFETAKLLKEKGFDEKCRALYTIWFDEVKGPKEDRAENWNIELRYFSAPTLQMAMKWLREEHKVYIMIDRSFSMEDSWHYCICVNDDFDNLIQQESRPHITYEEACEAAIKYILENLI